jgi:hypothetical protein
MAKIADGTRFTNVARRVWTVGSAPVNGTTLAGEAESGDLLARTDAGNQTLYQNTNTLASPTWTEITSGTNTLDEAYDQGGAGAGRSITADTGAVAITVPDTSNNAALALTQNDITNNPAAITITNAGSGNDITGNNSNWSVTAAGVGTFDSLSAGQVTGNTTAGGDLTLASTTYATKGCVTIADGEQGLKIGGTADRATTESTNALVLFNGTAPVGTLANGVTLYSSGGELKVMDAAGNSTLLSPHTPDGDYIIQSYSAKKDATIVIHLEKLLRTLANKDSKLKEFFDVVDGVAPSPLGL